MFRDIEVTKSMQIIMFRDIEVTESMYIFMFRDMSVSICWSSYQNFDTVCTKFKNSHSLGETQPRQVEAQRSGFRAHDWPRGTAGKTLDQCPLGGPLGTGPKSMQKLKFASMLQF